MRKKYLIFDLDGTLIQSDQDIGNIIFNYVENNIDPDLVDTARYIFENFQGMSLQETMERLIDDKKMATYHQGEITKLINNLKDGVVFFPGSIEKIKQLSTHYTLFLSTGDSDIFAHDVLKKGEIYHCFEKILGSTNILKSSLHIDEFISHTGDNDFSQSAVFIGDGQRDRKIAISRNIDFVHISRNSTNIYNIPSVKEIDQVLEKLNKKI